MTTTTDPSGDITASRSTPAATAPAATTPTETKPASLWPQLEALLPAVRQPVQYVGGEVNAVVKDWAGVDLRWCLMYPDAYAVGQPNQGLAILYEILNERDWILAERTYAIWPDLAGLMRRDGLRQFSWESHRPVGAFDILGVSLSTELGCTNLLEALDLAGVPLRAVDRHLGDPLVILGGHGATNPEPLADFVDAVVLGDGEQAVMVISELARDWKRRGGTRVELLADLARTGRVYVPQFYDVSYRLDGQIEAVRPNHPAAPATVAKWVLTELDDWTYPKAPIVPIAETVHERYSAEIFRGCLHGCRFCQAGMITRPVRERSSDVIAAMVDCGVKATGYDEVGLLSLSSADHSDIAALTHRLTERYAGANLALSLPSTRVDAFNVDLAEQLVRGGRRSGLTFAPEAGTRRLRQVINKTVDDADLLATVEAAFAQGWRSVKLYFMCGLPTETDADVAAIADLARRVIDTGRRVSGRRDIACTVSIGAFVPKAQTPFQWAGQTDPALTDGRMRALKESVRSDRRYARAITVKWAAGQPGQIEGLLARGDRRVGAVVEAVWRDGGVFDGWSEYFSYDRWVRQAAAVLEPLGTSLDWYTGRQRDRAEVLPWDHLSVGLDRDWLWDDWCDAQAGVTLPDCRVEGCTDCGVCPRLGVAVDLTRPMGSP